MKILAAIFRFLLALRYRMNIEGEHLLKNKTTKLFLPNHQALVDPQIISTKVLKHTNFIPIVSAKFYNIPLLNKVFRHINAIPINNMQTGNIDTNVMDNLLDHAINRLKNGHNVLIYPAGQLTGQGFEKIFNATS